MTINIKTNEFRLSDSELKAVFKVIYKNLFYVYMMILILLFLVTLKSFNIFIENLIIEKFCNIQNLKNFFDVFHNFLILALFFIGFIVNRKQSFNTLKNNQLMQKSSFIEVNHNYIIQSYEDGSLLKFNFDLFYEVVKSEGFYIFIGKDIVSFILPERACNSELELQELKVF